jgi:serine protease 16
MTTTAPIVALSLVLVLLVTCGSQQVEAAPRRQRSMYDALGLYQQKQSQLAVEDPVYPAPRYFSQDQDHFDGTNVNTWLQAYYVNDTFWTPGSDAPVFLCVGGEGPPLDGSVVVSSLHCNDAVELLPRTGALMLALEHRYYGCHNMSACPVTSWTGPNPLKYLSSRQALADLAGFHEFAVGEFNLTDANKWVTFGGSYPGMLSGW